MLALIIIFLVIWGITKNFLPDRLTESEKNELAESWVIVIFILLGIIGMVFDL